MNRRNFLRSTAIASGLIFVPSYLAGPAQMRRRGGAVRAVANNPATVDYFGYQTLTGGAYGSGYDTTWQSRNTSTYRLTASKSGTIVSLEIYGYILSGTDSKIRLALYDTSYNLITQGTALKLLSNTSAAWVGHTELNPNNSVVVAGTAYIMCFCFTSSNKVKYYYTAGSTGDIKQKAVSTYIGSDYPASLNYSGETSINSNLAFRVGVL